MNKLPFKSRSQAVQDVFAYKICGANDSYIEIGANKPIGKNNTYQLESKLGYTGFSIEFNQKYLSAWQESDRKNKIYIADAITFDYNAAIKECNMNKEVGYLSCDIEPPSKTFAALQRVIEQGIKFKCITFEHDAYQSTENYDAIARDFLQSNDYKVAVENVYVKQQKEKIFETWFVHNSIDFEKMDYQDWRNKFL